MASLAPKNGRSESSAEHTWTAVTRSRTLDLEASVGDPAGWIRECHGDVDRLAAVTGIKRTEDKSVGVAGEIRISAATTRPN